MNLGTLTLSKWPCSMCCNCQCARRPVLWARTLYKSWVGRSWWGHTSCVFVASPGRRQRYNLSTQTTSSPQVWCLSLDSHFTFFTTDSIIQQTSSLQANQWFLPWNNALVVRPACHKGPCCSRKTPHGRPRISCPGDPETVTSNGIFGKSIENRALTVPKNCGTVRPYRTPYPYKNRPSYRFEGRYDRNG